MIVETLAPAWVMVWLNRTRSTARNNPATNARPRFDTARRPRRRDSAKANAPSTGNAMPQRQTAVVTGPQCASVTRIGIGAIHAAPSSARTGDRTGLSTPVNRGLPNVLFHRNRPYQGGAVVPAERDRCAIRSAADAMVDQLIVIR